MALVPAAVVRGIGSSSARLFAALLSGACLVVGGCSASLPSILSAQPPTAMEGGQRYAALGDRTRSDAPTRPAPAVPGEWQSGNEAEPARRFESTGIGEGGTEIAFGTGRFVKQSASGGRAEALADGDVVLNFSETDVREVAQSILGEILGVNFVVDIDSQARVTLRTNRPIPRTSVLPTLETTLAASGLALVREGEVYRIVPSAKAKGGAKTVRMFRDKSGLGTGYGVVAVPLKYVAPSALARVLQPMAPENSILRVDDSRNLLLLAAIGPELETMLETIEMFDVDGMKGMSFGFFKIASANVSDVIGELKSIMKAHAEGAGIAIPQLIALQRLNALLVICARPEILELAQDWISRLDRSVAGAERRVFVHHVKNRKAKDIAVLLSNVFLSVGIGGSSPTAPDGPAKSDATPPDEAQAELSSGAVKLASGQSDSDASGIIADAATQLNESVRIVADDENNDLIIRATQADYKIVVRAIEQLDLVAPLVMIEVTIAEVNLKDGLKFGIDWFFKQQRSTFTFSSINSGQILSKFPGFSYFFSAADVAAVLNAVADITDVRIVSSPRVMVRDNKTATLQIGDQVPVVTSTVRSVTAPDAPVVQTVQYFDTGVILKVTPQVNARGLVTMDVSQEVSNVARQNEDGVESPTIQQRKLSSSIAIQSGEAVVLGGLMRENRSTTNTGVPFLAEIPAFGNVFKTHDKSKERTELLVVITPRVVWGRSEAQLVTNELRQQLEDVAVTQDRGTRAFVGARSPDLARHD